MKKNIDEINNKKDFLNFIQLLIEDLKNNPNEWENRNLEDYLMAVANWTEDMDGFYKNHDLPIPSNIDWKVFANILYAAKMYE